MKILLVALTLSFMPVGCTPRIEVAAPKEPTTISMNVEIEHEIVIKTGKSVGELPETRSDPSWGGDEENITPLCVPCWAGRQ